MKIIYGLNERMCMFRESNLGRKRLRKNKKQKRTKYNRVFGPTIQLLCLELVLSPGLSPKLKDYKKPEYGIACLTKKG